MSETLREMRESMAQDEKTRLMMDALRGKNLNDDDRQGDGIDMKVVEMRAADDASDVLPTFYDPVLLEAYFRRRPGAVLTRVWQVLSASGGYLTEVLFDFLTGNTADMEVRRAAQLRNTIVSLGPFAIKLGQALSIRPDILSPRAMVELQQLCDKVTTTATTNDGSWPMNVPEPPCVWFSPVCRCRVSTASWRTRRSRTSWGGP